MWNTTAAPERSDEELMVDCRGGGDGGSRLFARYREPVWRFFRRRVHDAGVAEELAQDVFVALLRLLFCWRTSAPRWSCGGSCSAFPRGS